MRLLPLLLQAQLQVLRRLIQRLLSKLQSPASLWRPTLTLTTSTRVSTCTSLRPHLVLMPMLTLQKWALRCSRPPLRLRLWLWRQLLLFLRGLQLQFRRRTCRPQSLRLHPRLLLRQQ